MILVNEKRMDDPLILSLMETQEEKDGIVVRMGRVWRDDGRELGPTCISSVMRKDKRRRGRREETHVEEESEFEVDFAPLHPIMRKWHPSYPIKPC